MSRPARLEDSKTAGIGFRIREIFYALTHRPGLAGKAAGRSSGSPLAYIILVAISFYLMMFIVAPGVIAFAESFRISVPHGLTGFAAWAQTYMTEWILRGWSYVRSIWYEGLGGMAIPVTAMVFFIWAGLVLVPRVSAAKSSQSKRTTIFDQPVPIKHGTCGNSRVEYDDRVLAATTQTWDCETELKYSSFVLGYSQKLHKAYMTPEEAHVLLCAPAGTGKTSRNLVSTIRAAICSTNTSLVLFDFKGELYGLTGEDARKSGHKVMIIDYVNWRRSQLFNPLTSVIEVYEQNMAIYRQELELAADAQAAGDTQGYAHHLREARNARVEARAQAAAMADNVCRAIAPDTHKTDAFWTPSARNLMKAMILLVCTYHEEDWVGEGPAPTAPEREQRTFQTIQALLHEKGKEKTVMVGGIKESRTELQELFDGLDLEHPANQPFSQARNSSGQTLASIVSSLDNYLTDVAEETNNMISYDTEVDLESIGEEPTIVYLVASTDQAGKKVMVPVITSLIYQACIRTAQRHGGSMPCHVIFLLEELGSFQEAAAGLPLDQMLGTGRSFGIRVVAVLQTTSQLRLLFGSDKAEANANLFNYTVFLNINDAKSAKEVSDSIGNYTITVPDGRGGLTQKGVPVVPPATLEAWDSNWGSFVSRDKNGANTWMNKLFYHRRGSSWAMYPTAGPAWLPANINMGIDTKAKAAAKAERAAAEDRSAERVVVKPWLAETLSATEQEELRSSFVVGGVDARTRTDLEQVQIGRAENAEGFAGWKVTFVLDARAHAVSVASDDPFRGTEAGIAEYIKAKRKVAKTALDEARMHANRLVRSMEEAVLEKTGVPVAPEPEADTEARREMKKVWLDAYERELEAIVRNGMTRSA